MSSSLSRYLVSDSAVLCSVCRALPSDAIAAEGAPCKNAKEDCGDKGPLRAPLAAPAIGELTAAVAGVRVISGKRSDGNASSKAIPTVGATASTALGLLALEPAITGVVVADAGLDCPTMYGEGTVASEGPDGTPRLTRCAEVGESKSAWAAAADPWAANPVADADAKENEEDEDVDSDKSGCKDGEEDEAEAGDDEDA